MSFQTGDESQYKREFLKNLPLFAIECKMRFLLEMEGNFKRKRTLLMIPDVT